MIMPEKPEATTEELEFIFRRFVQGLSDKEILEEMNDTEFPLRNTRFVGEMRRYFEAAKGVSREQLLSEIDPVINQQRIEHLQRLAETAGVLLEDGLDKIVVDKKTAQKDKYDILIAAYPESITHKRLVGRLEGNIDSACERYGTWWVFDCFIPHIEAEYPAGQDFYISMEANPIQLIVTLMTLAQKKVFQGTCPVCEEW